MICIGISDKATQPQCAWNLFIFLADLQIIGIINAWLQILAKIYIWVSFITPVITEKPSVFHFASVNHLKSW